MRLPNEEVLYQVSSTFLHKSLLESWQFRVKINFVLFVVYSVKDDYDVVDSAGKLAVLYLKMIVKLELFSQQNMRLGNFSPNKIYTLQQAKCIPID